MTSPVLIRGGGDLASGIALRLHHAHLQVVITELPEPLAVRRSVAFSEAVYSGEVFIEGVGGRRVADPADRPSIRAALEAGWVAVLVDPDCLSARWLQPAVIVDARMTKQPPEPLEVTPRLLIGLGPGFIAGTNCQVVVETRRGPTLGRVFRQGGPEADTGQPDGDPRRVLRAPAEGLLLEGKRIGEHCEPGERIAEIQQPDGSRVALLAPFAGVLRGMIHPGLHVPAGMKVGDLDPRDDPRLALLASDKALAIAGGVLEAILAEPALRSELWP